ncbi:M24 family metallopeptidase [Aliterella atlantica]|uniref:Peptidase M24 n=1 Tax=Aliterella atlantica CENA595 TaxID=1618023 RepID=A0A0D8ZRJ9_9CYAN|nr:M24 family metallopeptidase [Aliterella atlantica]KJH70977.1 peptidase M24 [Aliterella atlantica CENA595]
MNAEVAAKLELIRQFLVTADVIGVRFKGIDWFAWVTAGASNAVLLTAETGVAEVLVTAADAWVLTDEIEAQRLQDEELPAFQLHVNPWADSAAREAFVREATNGGKICSDRPTTTETPLPELLVNYKRVMMPSEIERYRQVGQKASAAMTEVLSNAKPTWTEYQLAGAGAEALWARGLHPALTLVAGERRLPLYRHATPSSEPISQVAMMVFCARGYGLYANLTRFVCFGKQDKYAQLHQHVREIEAQALDSCKPGVALNAVYQQLKQAYEQHGYPQAIYQHHQGGTCGYLAREIVANPDTTDTITANTAMAWNPSLPGAKVEDTCVLLEDGKLENLTFDPSFPSVEIAGRLRPVPLEIG